jgi:hypothetical protein
MAWRRRWADCWDEVRHCSDACRGRRGGGASREAFEAAILALLGGPSGDDGASPRGLASICPSEAARVVAEGRGLDGDAWRALMEPTREAGRRLVAEGRLEVTQGGAVVDAATARGPIRYRLKRR